MYPHYMYAYQSQFRGRRYGFTNFVGDSVMTCVTCGFWLIWIFVREMRNR